MKRTVTVLLALILGGSLAYGATNQVLSRNAVGYVRVDVEATNLALACIPFNDVSGDEYTIAEVMGNQMAGGGSFILSDNLMKFDVASGGYVIFWKHDGTGQWRQFPQSVETTNTLAPGEGFWLKNNQDTNQTVYLMGEVPDEVTAPTQDVVLVEGLQFMSYGYPVEREINDLSLTGTAHRGGSFLLSDNIITWDPGIKNYKTYWLPSSGGWRLFPEGSDTTNTLKPGEGAWFKRYTGQGTFTWREKKTYTWP